MDRNELGRVVRHAWVEWAEQQPDPKPSHLVLWDELDEGDKEVDRRIGEDVEAVVLRRLQGVLEHQREHMIGMEMGSAAAQMALIAYIAAEMGLESVWGFPVRIKAG